MASNGVTCVMSHASYLMNLAAPTVMARKRSFQTFCEELKRCGRLGVQMLNFHPGAHLGSGDEKGLAFAADCVRKAIETTPDAHNVTIVIENTAGQGSCIGHRFEHLAKLLARIGYEHRVGICLDTQHAFAAGFDVRHEEGFEAALSEFDAKVGRTRLRAFHLNDSKVELGALVDRHENLGKGEIGFDLFARLARDPRFAALPGFLETPGGAPSYRKELKQLRRACGVTAPLTPPTPRSPAPRRGLRDRK